MKRSEMKEIMAKAMRDYECAGRDYSQEDLDKVLGAYSDLADAGMEAIEKAGMLPPIPDYAKQYASLCKWEPE